MLDEELLDESGNFIKLIQKYGVDRKNPIIVRLLGMYILQTCTAFFPVISFIATPTHHIALITTISFTNHVIHIATPLTSLIIL